MRDYWPEILHLNSTRVAVEFVKQLDAMAPNRDRVGNLEVLTKSQSITYWKDSSASFFWTLGAVPHKLPGSL